MIKKPITEANNKNNNKINNNENKIMDKTSPKKKLITKNITLNNSNMKYNNSKDDDIDIQKSFNDFTKNSATKRLNNCKQYIKNNISINLNKSNNIKENDLPKFFKLNPEKKYENNYTLYVIDNSEDVNTIIKNKNNNYFSKDTDYNEIRAYNLFPA